MSAPIRYELSASVARLMVWRDDDIDDWTPDTVPLDEAAALWIFRIPQSGAALLESWDSSIRIVVMDQPWISRPFLTTNEFGSPELQLAIAPSERRAALLCVSKIRAATSLSILLDDDVDRWQNAQRGAGSLDDVAMAQIFPDPVAKLYAQMSEAPDRDRRRDREIGAWLVLATRRASSAVVGGVSSIVRGIAVAVSLLLRLTLALPAIITIGAEMSSLTSGHGLVRLTTSGYFEPFVHPQAPGVGWHQVVGTYQHYWACVAVTFLVAVVVIVVRLRVRLARRHARSPEANLARAERRHVAQNNEVELAHARFNAAISTRRQDHKTGGLK